MSMEKAGLRSEPRPIPRGSSESRFRAWAVWGASATLSSDRLLLSGRNLLKRSPCLPGECLGASEIGSPWCTDRKWV